MLTETIAFWPLKYSGLAKSSLLPKS
uniref:Uncharacterized protein n=1 Tax=Arundo donax TaxID=35708 RepID=A0A0A8ZJH2_ARUDO